MVEQLRIQMKAMEEWKGREQALLRQVFRWLCVGLVFFMLAVGVGFWQINSLVNKNRQLINKIETLAYEQAQANYEDCQARNARTRTSISGFKKLVKAHTKDGNLEAARVWTEYLQETQKQKLPPCVKPAPQRRT